MLYRASKLRIAGQFISFVGYGYLALWNKCITHIPSYTVRYWAARLLYGLKIGRSTIHSNVRFLSPWNIRIGDNVNIQMDSFLDGRGGISIANNVDITMGVKILTEEHDIQSSKYDTVREPVRIADNAVIGSFATILPGVTIGTGAVIGSGSVVVKDVPVFEMHSGNPAVFKRKRNCEIEYRLYYRRPFH
jgi:putative colanic acid biosynthesis acetyltransferase WcaF